MKLCSAFIFSTAWSGKEERLDGALVARWAHGKIRSETSRKFEKTVIQMRKAEPIRVSVAHHWCLNDTAVAHLVNFAALVVEKSLCVRMKIHFGKFEPDPSPLTEVLQFYV